MADNVSRRGFIGRLFGAAAGLSLTGSFTPESSQAKRKTGKPAVFSYDAEGRILDIREGYIGDGGRRQYPHTKGTILREEP